jgi:serine/threonine protein kinase
VAKPPERGVEDPEHAPASLGLTGHVGAARSPQPEIPGAVRPLPEPETLEPRASMEPASGGSEQFSLASGESEAPEVQPELPDLALDEDLVRYEDGPILGAGGMGEVRLRRDKRVGRNVAMKLMHSHVETADTRQRFLREARVQGQLEHPAIVPVYDLGVESGRLFFTMKRVRGQTLARILFGLASGEEDYVKRFSRRRILATYLQVCRAVHYAHVHGVLHRDLKPSNVMVGDYGEVYVLDWGLARTLDVRPAVSGERERHSIVVADASRYRRFRPNITKPGNLIGTLAYMAPEQARGEPLDARADVYALGVILYEILALRRFRDDSNYLRVIAQIVDGVVARPSDHVDIDPALDEICVRATAVEREERYETAIQIAEDIEHWLDGARDAEARKRGALTAIAAAKAKLREPSPEAKATAVHELLRALSLDEGNREAENLIVNVLSDTEGEALPKEAEAQIEARRTHNAGPGAPLLLLVAAALAIAIPGALFALGVTDTTVLGAAGLCAVLVSALALLARAAHGRLVARLDANERKLAIQAYHLKRLFPGAVTDDAKDRLSQG